MAEGTVYAVFWKVVHTLGRSCRGVMVCLWVGGGESLGCKKHVKHWYYLWVGRIVYESVSALNFQLPDPDRW